MSKRIRGCSPARTWPSAKYQVLGTTSTSESSEATSTTTESNGGIAESQQNSSGNGDEDQKWVTSVPKILEIDCMPQVKRNLAEGDDGRWWTPWYQPYVWMYDHLFLEAIKHYSPLLNYLYRICPRKEHCRPSVFEYFLAWMMGSATAPLATKFALGTSSGSRLARNEHLETLCNASTGKWKSQHSYHRSRPDYRSLGDDGGSNPWQTSSTMIPVSQTVRRLAMELIAIFVARTVHYPHFANLGLDERPEDVHALPPEPRIHEDEWPKWWEETNGGVHGSGAGSGCPETGSANPNVAETEAKSLWTSCASATLRKLSVSVPALLLENQPTHVLQSASRISTVDNDDSGLGILSQINLTETDMDHAREILKGVRPNSDTHTPAMVYERWMERREQEQQKAAREGTKPKGRRGEEKGGYGGRGRGHRRGRKRRNWLSSFDSSGLSSQNHHETYLESSGGESDDEDYDGDHFMGSISPMRQQCLSLEEEKADAGGASATGSAKGMRDSMKSRDSDPPPPSPSSLPVQDLMRMFGASFGPKIRVKGKVINAYELDEEDD
ncbi:hypothetical protein HK102_001948 [Quaeritorhiza haematococci]|nr:hypothetical protein HK102_001948 [Quaeritorhiza haematococci]